MTHTRFARTLALVALVAMLAAVGGLARAQAPAYPNKPVHVVVAFTAGGTTDILARAVAQKLSDKLGQAFVIDNKPGGGGNIGTESVVRAKPDGYTLIVNSVGPIAVNQTLYKKLNYDPMTDLVPIVQIADVPNVLIVNPDLPVTTMEEFIAYARANPGKLNYGSTGIGTSSHLSSFMLSKQIGAETTHIPYKGADALTDLLAGRTQFMFATIPSAIGQIKAGRLRAIAVSSAKRSRSMPDIPTVAEKGFPGFAAGSWFGFFAPKGTPASVIDTLNAAVNEALPSLEAQLIREGADPGRRQRRAVRSLHAGRVREVEGDRARIRRDGRVMASAAPLRLLLSAPARARLQDRIASTLDGAAHLFVEPGEDADLAFVSRDVTGLSTKHDVLHATQRFYDAMQGAAHLRWVHIHSPGSTGRSSAR